MSGFKKFLLGLNVPVLSLLVIAIVAFISVNFTVGQIATVKEWINDTGVYPAASTTLVTQLSKTNVTVSGQQVSLERPEVVAVLSSNLSGSFIQQSVETILDGSYAWIQGKTPTPVYAVDLAPVKTAVIDGLATSARSRLTTLPACSARNLPTTTDVLAINCQPPTAVSEAQITDIVRQLQASTEILPQTTITADTTNLGVERGQAQPVPPAEPWYQQAQQLPKLYSWSQRGFWIACGLALLLIIGIILLARNLRSGMKILAVTLLSCGILIGLIAGISLFVNDLFMTSFGLSSEAVGLEEPLQQLVQTAARSVGNIQLLAGLGLIVFSLITLVVLHVTKPKTVVPAKPAV